MAKEFYKSTRFRDSSIQLIAKCTLIIDRYREQGYALTLRQLYYQLVTQNEFKNEERSYKNLGSIVSDARLAGLIDWDAIEDRVRVPRIPSEWNNVAELVESALYAYRMPRWKDQDNYAELWVEKDAIANVLAPIAHEFHIPLMVNRGYSSMSAMHQSGKRFKRAERAGKDVFLFYLGDHDPSGEDMVRDVRERLEMFGVRRLEVEKIALTMDQIEEYDPPPNPAKLSDSRAKKYVDTHGESSWEVDALPPDVLADIIRSTLERVTDMEKIEAVKAREEEDKELLRKAVADIMKNRR